MSDNWKHRSEGMRCGTCMSFATKAPCTTFGRCRKHAPTMGGFPAVFYTDWCGDHKLDENKIEPIENHKEMEAYQTIKAMPDLKLVGADMAFRCEECGFMIGMSTADILVGDTIGCPMCLHNTIFEVGKDRHL